MKNLLQLLLSLFSLGGIQAKPKRRARQQSKRRRAQRKTRRVLWTGEYSKTQREIIAIISAEGPMTRAAINARLDVSTSHQLLPRMVERGVITASGWPYIYALVSPLPQEQEVSESHEVTH